MVFEAKAVGDMCAEFQRGRARLNDVSVEIVGGEAEIDTLTMLRVYEQEVTIDNELILVAGFCMNRTVRFHKKGQVIFEVTFDGSDVGSLFKTAPYLLDLLAKTCYGIMLKKLTPPSEDSNNEEQR